MLTSGVLKKAMKMLEKVDPVEKAYMAPVTAKMFVHCPETPADKSMMIHMGIPVYFDSALAEGQIRWVYKSGKIIDSFHHVERAR